MKSCDQPLLEGQRKQIGRRTLDLSARENGREKETAVTEASVRPRGYHYVPESLSPADPAHPSARVPAGKPGHHALRGTGLVHPRSLRRGAPTPSAALSGIELHGLIDPGALEISGPIQEEEISGGDPVERDEPRLAPLRSIRRKKGPLQSA